MNWDAISAIAESLGVIGVIGSLIYVAYEIRTNTNAIRASSTFAANQTFSDMSSRVSEWPDSMMEEVEKLFVEGKTLSDLPFGLRFRFSQHWRALFMQVEAQYYQYKYGFLETDLWQSRRAYFRGFIEIPAMKEWWDMESKEGILSEEFIREIESGNMAEIFQAEQQAKGS